MRAIDAARQHAVEGCLLCTVGLGVMVVLAYYVEPARHLDQSLLDALDGPPGTIANDPAYLIEQLVNPVSQALAVVAVCCLAVLTGRPRRAPLAIALVAGTAVLVQVLKIALEHSRYHAVAGDPFYWHPIAKAFPSGNSAGALSIALAFLVVVPASWRQATAILGACFTLAVSAGLLALDYHYPSDVLGGWLAAAAWAFALLALLPQPWFDRWRG